MPEPTNYPIDNELVEKGRAARLPSYDAKDDAPTQTVPVVSKPNQNDASNADPYGPLISYVEQRVAETKPKKESDADKAKRERKEKREQLMAGLVDGLGSFHKAYSHARGVKPMDIASLGAHLRERYKAQADAVEKNKAEHLALVQLLADITAKRDALTFRNLKEASEQKLREREETRKDNAEALEKELQPYKVREAAGKASKSEADAITAEAQARYADDMWSAKLSYQNARTEAQKAYIQRALAAAKASNYKLEKPYYAEDKDGNGHWFSKADAAELFAKQNGTWSVDILETVREEKGANPMKNKTVVTKKESGYPRRGTRLTNTAEQGL